jgi:aspartyl-tRNA(Asn)/glutamyl-tRNA(Gln) amidotransferase subunit A
MTIDILRYDTVDLAALLARRSITPSSLLKLYFDRISCLNSKLNAFSHLDYMGALEAAESADMRQKYDKRLGPLDGIPVCIKDNLFVKDMPAAWGSKLVKNFVPDKDDICVERLRAAGAIIIGKTTTPEFALIGRTENLVTGITRNPWNLNLHPGGSSGGASSAVAAGLVPVAICTDAGGSSRLPASYAGVVGIRPSNGKIPRRYGFLPMALDFQTIGIITRTVRDQRFIFDIISGPDTRDPLSLQYNLKRTISKNTLKIGYFSSIGTECVAPSVEVAHQETIDILRTYGHQLEECNPPFDLAEIRSIWSVLTTVGATRAALKYGEDWEALATNQVKDLVSRGRPISSCDYVYALDRLQNFRSEVSASWGNYDAIITPTNPIPAWPVETEQPTSFEGRSFLPASQNMFCGWVNALGFSGISIPGPVPKGNLPIGIQIIARSGDDDIVLNLAEQLERIMPWRDRWPDIAELKEEKNV